MEDNPDPLEESSADSSESEASLSGESADKEPTVEPVLQPSKTLDISLNFRLGHSGTQVMAQFSRPKPPLAVESSLMISKHLALRLATSEAAALLELQALAGPETLVPSPATSQPMALEYIPAQLESSRTKLKVCARPVRAYMVDHGDWVECVQPPPPPILPICLAHTNDQHCDFSQEARLPGHTDCGSTPDYNHGAQGRPERVVHQQSDQSVTRPLSTVWVIRHEDE